MIGGKTMPRQRMFLFSRAERYADKVDRLLETLADGQWYTARELTRILLVDDRTLRKYADLSGGRVISGDLGYKLTRFATNDEIDHAEARLLSQARKMQDRAREIRICRNRGAAA